VNTAEHLEAAERAVALAEPYISDQKYDRVTAFAALATAHVLLAQAKGGSR
jgi:hypothetical protein